MTWKVANYGPARLRYFVYRDIPGGIEIACGTDGRYRRFARPSTAQRVADELNAS